MEEEGIVIGEKPKPIGKYSGLTDDMLLVFSAKNYCSYEGSWKDMKCQIDYLCVLKKVPRNQRLEWLDIENTHSSQERMKNLLIAMKSRDLLDIFAEALSKKNVPLHRKFEQLRQNADSERWITFQKAFLGSLTLYIRECFTRVLPNLTPVRREEILSSEDKLWTTLWNRAIIQKGDISQLRILCEQHKTELSHLLRICQQYEDPHYFESSQVEKSEKNAKILEESEVQMNPLAAVIKTNSKVLTTGDLLRDASNHYRNAIITAMNQTMTWKKLLAQLGHLSGNEMEKWVANLSREWEETRSNNPAQLVLQSLYQNDTKFAQMPLDEFATLLTNLCNEEVNKAAAEMLNFYQSKQESVAKKNAVAYEAQDELRAWLITKEICEEIEVDQLVLKLRGAGVKNIKSLQGFSKEDLKEVGFNTVQAISVVNKLKK